MASHTRPKGPQAITLDMVLASTTLTRSSSETSEAYLGRVTHLHLQAKRIFAIDGLDMCKNLKVLYLYDNQIEAIQNLDFASKLQYLQLQNNNITEIPSLDMPNLIKLYLDGNKIQILTGLESCTRLEDLRIANQRYPSPEVSLQFDLKSLDAFSRTLNTLEISGTGIVDITPIFTLRNLRRLFCAKNRISNLEDVQEVISFPLMEEANFKGNPCCSIPKYRDHLIGASSDALTILDEVPVPKHQQIAIKGLMKHRRQIVGMGMITHQMKLSEEQRRMKMRDFENAEPIDLNSAPLVAGGTALPMHRAPSAPQAP